MKLSFTGTQRGMTRKQSGSLRKFMTAFGVPLDSVPMFVHEGHHGDCIGADKEFNSIARQVGLRRVIHPPTKPDKRAFCKGEEIREPKSYIIRNHDVVDDGEMLLAAPGEMYERLRSGTWATVRYALKRGKPVLIFYPDGSVERRKISASI